MTARGHLSRLFERVFGSETTHLTRIIRAVVVHKISTMVRLRMFSLMIKVLAGACIIALIALMVVIAIMGVWRKYCCGCHRNTTARIGCGQILELS